MAKRETRIMILLLAKLFHSSGTFFAHEWNAVVVPTRVGHVSVICFLLFL